MTASSGDPVLDSRSERITIQIDLGTDGLDAVLQEGERADVKLVDESGGSSLYGVNVPDVISDQDYVQV